MRTIGAEVHPRLRVQALTADHEPAARLFVPQHSAVSRREHFRDRLGALLLESEVCCTNRAHCVALARFGTAEDAGLLAASLDRYLRRPDLAYGQPTAMGTPAYTDSALHRGTLVPCPGPVALEGRG
ncbi:DUF6000 family protein [Streptomyces sp. NPDC059070]|uniref:DUF6000 family protein n=1 Tax=Streptomyces sp. NPDC059070 TaxID=3346713 RepID=UPI00367957CD